MGVDRFEDLRVWQAAKQQSDRVGALLQRQIFRQNRILSDQLDRAAVSVLLNITEGFLRRRDKETMQFLRYALASNGELKAGYYAADGREFLLVGEVTSLIELNESIARMLRRWQGTLGNGRPGGRTKDLGRTKDPGRTKDLGRTKYQEPRTEDVLRTETAD